ncbi:RAF-like serine/threonine-protein kinase 24 isoform X3 [Tasmannia lanceolata]|uniref:RAF-like serine/threonine-protein kinase 24 isoform X3 n=1 Tax=Tasmannia lanceolata TaxID=3420 RepID=UPI004062E9D3
MKDEKSKLLCSFGGEFIKQKGKICYFGGKTRLVKIDRRLNFKTLMLKMADLCGSSPRSVIIKFRLPEDADSFESRLVSVESDEDVSNMLDEFECNQKIPLFLFSEKTLETIKVKTELKAARSGLWNDLRATYVNYVKEGMFKELVTCRVEENASVGRRWTVSWR